MALKCHVTPARLVFRSRHPRRLGHHIREFGLVGYQDRLTVEPGRDPGAGALDLDRVPLGSRPRRFADRAFEIKGTERIALASATPVFRTRATFTVSRCRMIPRKACHADRDRSFVLVTVESHG